MFPNHPLNLEQLHIAQQVPRSSTARLGQPQYGLSKKAKFLLKILLLIGFVLYLRLIDDSNISQCLFLTKNHMIDIDLVKTHN